MTPLPDSDPLPAPTSVDVDRWREDLFNAGWTEKCHTIWVSPVGGVFRGPYAAWKAMRAQTPDHVAEARGHDDLWGWFGLSRASWLTLPRALMHEMPDAWQGRMAALLHEFDAAYPFMEQPGYGTQVTLKRERRFVSAPSWLTNYRHPDRDEMLRRTR